MAGPSPPPAIDNRGGARARPDDVSKYGTDPRPQDISSDSEWWSSSYKSGKVNILEHAEQLQAAMDAAKSEQLVVVRFVRKGCAACGATAPLYEKLASVHASKAQFFAVDFDEARPFCKQAKLKFVPAVHIYNAGGLDIAMPAGKKSWEKFDERLSQLTSTL